VSHPKTRQERRAAATRCNRKRSRRFRFARRLNALLAIHRRHRELLKLLETVAT
jgi:hypothetical protein